MHGPSYDRSMSLNAIINEFEKMPLDEKGDLLARLWSAYEAAQAAVGFSEDECDELDRRMAAYRADPSIARERADVHGELRARLSES